MKKLNFQLLAVLFTALVFVMTACSKDNDDNPPPEPDEYTIIDDGSGTGTTTWKFR